jgi:hypothetical protein
MSYKTPGGNKSDYNEQIKDETINMAGGDGTSSAPSHDATHGSIVNPNDMGGAGVLAPTDTSQNQNISDTVANVDNSTLKTSVGDDYSSEYNKASQAWKDAGSVQMNKVSMDSLADPSTNYIHDDNVRGGWTLEKGEIDDFRKTGKSIPWFRGGAIPETNVHKDEGGNIIDNRVQNQSTITPKPTPKKDKAWDYVKSVSTPSSSAEKGNTSYQSQQSDKSAKITKKENKAWAKERTKTVKGDIKQRKKDISTQIKSEKKQLNKKYKASSSTFKSAFTKKSFRQAKGY